MQWNMFGRTNSKDPLVVVVVGVGVGGGGGGIGCGYDG